jgi:hypothetical protein
MQLNAKNISHIDKKIILNDGQIIVAINVTENDGAKWTNDECNFNIYCIDQLYNIIWQVKETKTKPISIFGETDSFCYLGKDAKGEIIADRFSGFTYKIDPETGEAEQTGFHK